MKNIDLHTHSTASDGTDSPACLVSQACDLGLGALAITDHDTVNGLAEGQKAARARDLELIRGCEISTKTPYGSMHILGLWLPEDCRPLEEFLEDLRQRRDRRNQQIIQKFQNNGVDITLEEVAAKASRSVGRPHFATVLLEKGYVRSHEEAFELWLGDNGKAYVPRDVPGPHEAVRILADLGASPIIAHPLLRPSFLPYLRKYVAELKPCGLFGLEAWHSDQSPEMTSEVLAVAKEYELAVSGGSDYHGANKPHISLGKGRGQLQVPCSVLEKMKQRRRIQGLPV